MIALATALSSNYYPYFEHFFKSILAHNPDFDKDHVIFYTSKNTEWLTLKQEHIDKLKELYKHFVFHEIDFNLYAKYGKAHPIYYSIECFNLDYDRVIYCDSDFICVQPLDELWEYSVAIEGIGMMKEKRRPSFNAGLIIIGKEYMNRKTYLDLVQCNYDHIKVFGHDQKIYNIYFEGKIADIHQKFNTLVSEINFIPKEEILLYHYIYKPTGVGAKRLIECSGGQRLIDEWRKYD